jgi:hypothetical protein
MDHEWLNHWMVCYIEQDISDILQHFQELRIKVMFDEVTTSFPKRMLHVG